MTAETTTADNAAKIAQRNRRFEIDGRQLGYPTEFRDGSSAMGMFLVPVGAADALIRESGFRAAEVFPGKAVLSLNCVHYTDTDCGEYEEIAFAVFVREHGARKRAGYISTIRQVFAAEIPSFTFRLAVTTRLSCDAGIEMWGFPKTIEDIEHVRQGGRAEFVWRADGGDLMRFSVPDSGSRNAAEISPPVYSIYEGTPHVGRLTQSYRDVGYHLRGGRLELGTHPVADELRALGLPKRPFFSVWNGGLTFSMSPPAPL